MFRNFACLFCMRTQPHLLIALIGGLMLAGCDAFERSVTPFSEADELVVLTVNSPDTYYENADGVLVGLEHDLASEFARDLGMKVRFKVVPRLDQALLALEKQKGHLVAGLSVSRKHLLQARFGPIYQPIQAQVVYNRHYPKPKNIDDLVGRSVEIAAGTAHDEQLKKAQRQSHELEWTERNVTSDELLAQLAEGKVDYVVVDSTQIKLAKNFYPNLEVAFDLGEATGRAWAFPLLAERKLLDRTRKFFDRIEQDGTLLRLLDRYYGHVERLQQTDVSGILRKRSTVLPDLREFFHEAEELTGIDWRLIAALAYQESHWDRLAVSPTNVRGIMMLTEVTADRMKVDDRLDPRKSIHAGARYLMLLRDRLPTRIREPDRTWIALAAYNQGPSHVEDARILAQRQGLNPDSWIDLKKTLPLLSQKKYFRDLKHGYARGGEAVVLTESVRTYYEILLKYEQPYSWGFTTRGDIPPITIQHPIESIIDFFNPG